MIDDLDEDIEYNPMVVRGCPRKEDVIGQARLFIDDFILAMKNETLYNHMGVKPDKSFLISGPPGNGKSLCIESLVNEANKELYESQGKMGDWNLVGYKYDIGQYGTAYINQGSRIVQGFFDACFNTANHGYKTLVVIDEADNLFAKRNGGGTHKEDSKVLETIMKNMQKLHDTQDIYAVMMSNFTEAFDDASIRAGRVDRKYIFDLPNQSEREFAYNHTIQQINDKAGYMVIRRYDTKILAEMSDNFSYSDIIESISAAVKMRVVELSKKRKHNIITSGYVMQNRLEDSINLHKATFVATKRNIGFHN